jgi:hypothetical protein
MRSILLGSLVVMALLEVRPAYAGRGGIVIINTGDDIIHIRDLPPEIATETGLKSIGYHYDRLGVFWLDVWRWGGEFVVYGDDGYAPVTAAQADALGGASVPWKYRAPPGLLLILAAIELAIVIATRRRAKVMLGLGGFWLAVAALLYVKGVDVAFAIPGLLGAHHIIGTWFALKAQDQAEAEAEAQPEALEPEAEPERSAPPGSAPAMGPPPNVETDPFRAPPRPPPINVIRHEPASTEAPIVPDDGAEKPKLLG